METSFQQQVNQLLKDNPYGTGSSEELAARIGEVAIRTLGDDESLDQIFPKQWQGQEKLKKDWVHSRNHLRRSLRAKFKS
jgi:hypothetical protein